jgi:hypothetical protein
MQVVLGNGEMPVRELTASLQDLWNEALEKTDNFWFVIQGKAEPTATDRALVAWLVKNDVWYSLVTDGSEVDPMYEEESQETTVAKRLAPTIVNLMKTSPEEGEGAQLLALFASDDFSAEEDRWLNDVGAAVQEAGFVVRALNDGLVEVDMSDVEPDEEVEEIEEELEAEEQSLAERLDEMGREEIIAYAQTKGITFPPRTRIPTMIAKLLSGTNGDAAVVADEELPEEPSLASVSNLPPSTSGAGLSAPAMVLIIANGLVTARVITPEQADAIVNA